MNSDRSEENSPSVDAAQTPHSGNRRRLICGGMIVAPVVLALKSTPVLACNCKLPSGFSTSGNLSRNAGSACTDPAKGPAWWPHHINHHKFAGTGIRTDKVFNSVFASSDVRSLLVVLNSGVTLASLVVAAYLDVKASRFVPGISDHDIKKMWAGTYKPHGSTLAWTLTESENYLRYTMGLPLINH